MCIEEDFDQFVDMLLGAQGGDRKPKPVLPERQRRIVDRLQVDANDRDSPNQRRPSTDTTHTIKILVTRFTRDKSRAGIFLTGGIFLRIFRCIMLKSSRLLGEGNWGDGWDCTAIRCENAELSVPIPTPKCK